MAMRQRTPDHRSTRSHRPGRSLRNRRRTLGPEEAEEAEAVEAAALGRPLAGRPPAGSPPAAEWWVDRKSTRLNSSHTVISYAVFCLKKKKKKRLDYDDDCATARDPLGSTDSQVTRYDHRD